MADEENRSWKTLRLLRQTLLSLMRHLRYRIQNLLLFTAEPMFRRWLKIKSMHRVTVAMRQVMTLMLTMRTTTTRIQHLVLTSAK